MVRHRFAVFFGIIAIVAGTERIVAAPERIKVTAGQPLCINQDRLVALLIAGVRKDPEAAKALPCEAMRTGSVAEVVERYPSGANSMRIVKVKVTSQGRGATTGYTIEIDR